MVLDGVVPMVHRLFTLILVSCTLLQVVHPAGWMPTACAQSDVRLSIPARLDFGANFANVERDLGSNWRQRPGAALLLSSGGSIRYKERIVLSTELGVLLDTYNFSSTYARYDVTHVVTQVRTNLSYNFLFKSDRSKAITVGCDFGRSFAGRNIRLRNESAFFVRAETFGPATNFFSPEIGWTRTWDSGQFSFLLAYMHYMTDRAVTRVEITESNGAQFVATAAGNYLAMRVRAHLDVKGHREPLQEYAPAPAPTLAHDFLTRETRTRKEVDSKRRVITLKFWDNAEVDGDTISVSLNGRFILTEQELVKQPKKVRVVLEPGENVIVVHAHNEGRIPPNTAGFSVRTSLFRKEALVFSTNLRRNEALVVRH